MAFPTVQTVSENSTNTAGTSHAITLPASIVETDVVMILMDIGSTSATLNALTDWTEILDEAVANGLKIIWYTGTGVPSNPTFTSSASTRSASITYRISGASKAITPQIATTGTGTSASPDVPLVSPTGGVAKDYLWIAFFGQAGEEADDDTWSNTPPTNYTPSPPRQKACGTAGTNLGGKIASAERQLNTGTGQNPDSFSSDASAAWRTQHIIVHPSETKDHTTDAVLLETATQTQTTDALIVNHLTKTQTSDALIISQPTKAHTADAAILNTQTKAQTADALVLKTQTKTHATDAVLKKTYAPAHTTYAGLQKTSTRVHTTDIVLKKTITSAHTTDARILDSQMAIHSTDVVLDVALSTETVTHTTDALLKETSVSSHGTDGLVQKVQVKTHTVDLVVLKSVSSTHGTDAVTFQRQTAGHTTDAALAAQRTQAHTVDALVTAHQIMSHNASAYLGEQILKHLSSERGIDILESVERR